LTGTASEIIPLSKIDHRIIGNGKIGPLTKEILKYYEQIVRGKSNKNKSWLTYLK